MDSQVDTLTLLAAKQFARAVARTYDISEALLFGSRARGTAHQESDADVAALLASHSPVPPDIAKTHSGLITAFSLHLVKTGRLSLELGRALNKVEDLRLIADYKGDPLSIDDAQWAAEQAHKFVTTIEQQFF